MVLATQAAMVLCAVAFQSLLAYMLLAEGRGAYAVCILFGSLLGKLFSPGCERGAQYLVMAGRMSLSQGVCLCLAVCLAGSVAAATLAVPAIYGDLSFFTKADTRSFCLALALVPLTSFSTALTMQLAGLRRFARLARLLPLRPAANLLALTILVPGFGLGVDGAVLSLAAGHAVLIAACLWELRRRCGLAPSKPTRDGLAQVLGYGLRYHPARLGAALQPRLGTLLLAAVASRAEIGAFALAAGLMTAVLQLPKAISAALLPRVAADGRGRPELVALCARASLWTTAAALAALLGLGEAPVRLLFSEAFLPAVALTRIMAPGILAWAAAALFMDYFLGTARPGVCSHAMWFGLGANAAAFFALYPPLGVEGAAWAMTAGLLARGAWIAAAFHRAAGMPPAAAWKPQRRDFHELRKAVRSAIRSRPRIS